MLCAVLAAGCGAGDARAVADFEEQHALVAERRDRMVAASYPYQMDRTPEGEVIAQVLARMRARASSRADWEEALAAERARRWYMDHFESEIEEFRVAVAALYGRASAIGDEQVRAAATQLCRLYAGTLQAAAGLLAAQRARSQQTVEFFSTLLSGERRFPSVTELEAASEQLHEQRERMVRTLEEHEGALAAFREAAARRLGARREPAAAGGPPRL